MMFKVIDKNTNIPVLVYSIKNDANGYPTFLIYTKNEWKWRSAKFFKPLDNNVYNNSINNTTIFYQNL